MALFTCLKLNDTEVSTGSWRVHPDFRRNKSAKHFAGACARLIVDNFGQPLKSYGASLYRPPLVKYFASPSPGKLMREWVCTPF